MLSSVPSRYGRALRTRNVSAVAGGALSEYQRPSTCRLARKRMMFAPSALCSASCRAPDRELTVGATELEVCGPSCDTPGCETAAAPVPGLTAGVAPAA